MTKWMRLATLGVAATLIPAVLSGCSASSCSSSDKNSLSIVGFSVLKTANEPVIAAFQKTPAGKDISFTASYGASGDQSRAVASGLHADEVHLSVRRASPVSPQGWCTSARSCSARTACSRRRSASRRVPTW